MRSRIGFDGMTPRSWSTWARASRTSGGACASSACASTCTRARRVAP